MTPADLKKLKAVFAKFNRENTLCPSCLGVGCLPKNFGMGNPNAKPCWRCKGRGFLKKAKKK